jgi:hypothetical protein
MALRQTFGSIVEMARNEARLSSNTSRGADHLDHIQQLVKRHYTMLCEDFDWEHLSVKRDVADCRVKLLAGSRYYDLPTAMNNQKIGKLWVKWGTVWREPDYGITFADYSSLDPDSDNRADPVLKWDRYGNLQFEVWPLPSTNGDAAAPYSGWVGFEGQRAAEAFVSDTNRADLDDFLIALYVAAELLAENGQKGASDAKIGAANSRRNNLRAALSDKSRFTMGRGMVTEAGRAYPRHPEALYRRG